MTYITSSPVALRADRHYESLRDAVWLRVVSDDPGMPWAAFEDAYQEAWVWITTRDRDGRPVVADSGSPVAYLAQTVRRRYVDQLRAARRGIGRDASGPVLEPLESVADRVGANAPEDLDDAREARRAVSAIYLLARDRLTERELQAFALSYMLEMKPAEGARAMGVSAKRFRNLRWDGWRKVGDDVLELLEGRLQWCASAEAADLRARALAGDQDASGPLKVHLAACAVCSHRMADARRAAAALLPLPLVVTNPAGFMERGLAWVETVFERALGAARGPAERLGALATLGQPSGRVLAVAATLAGSVAGGASVEPAEPPRTPRGQSSTASAARPDLSMRRAPVMRAHERLDAIRGSRDVRRHSEQRPRSERSSFVPAPARAASTTAPTPALPLPAPSPRPARDNGEFGFE